MSDYTIPSVPDLSFSETTFYGLKITPGTGRLTVEVINDGSPVELPVDDIDDVQDYETWFWTKYNVQFSWRADKKTHLLMEIK
jgi:hypothetical protein